MAWLFGGESVKSIILFLFEKLSIVDETGCGGEAVVYRDLYISAVGSMLDLGRLLVDDEVVFELGGVLGLELLLLGIVLVAGIVWE